MRMTIKEAMVRAERNTEAYGGNWQVLSSVTEEGRFLIIRRAPENDILPVDFLLSYETSPPLQGD